MVTVEKAPTYA